MVLDENKMAPVSEEPVFDSSSIAQARGRIRRTLEYSLKENYGIEDKDTVDKFMKMHGVSDKHFDFINNFENLVEMGSADASIDSNSNKSDVSIAGLLNEVSLPINKVVGYRYLYRKMKQMYGKKRAKYLAGRMYDMSLALADSTNILKPYCYALNAQKLVMEGRNWGTAPSLPPKRVASYISALAEVLHQISNVTAGALAVGSFFFDIAHMMLFKEGKGLKDITEDESYRKYIENCLQSFVHSMNSLSRNATESPFTNISIFDTVKLKSMIEDMAWYFDYYELNEKLAEETTEEGMFDYVVKVIVEVQELYCGIMDRGVVYDGGRPFTFPVSTFNFSRGKRDDGTYYIEDEEFLHNFCNNHDVVRYNIYCSEGNKVASCCFLGDQEFTYLDENNNVCHSTFKDFMDEYGDGSTKEIHIEDSKKYVIDPSTGEKALITGVIEMKNNFNEIITIELEDGTVIKATPNQKLFDKNSGEMVEASEILKNPSKYEL